MAAYSTKDVAQLLSMPATKVRAFARAGFVATRQSQRGRYHFSFQDVVVMRAAKSLTQAGVPPRRVWKALRELRRQVPAERSLAAIRIVADGNRLLARDERSTWHLGSGQLELAFDASELADAAKLVREDVAATAREPDASAEEWFNLGVDLELVEEDDEAARAYQRALDIDETLVDGWINLGRLRQTSGDVAGAENHYRRALDLAPAHAVATFNLGTVLDGLGRVDEALAAYDAALAIDPEFADAHFNLGRLEERRGNARAAIRHLARYRALTEPTG